MVGAVEGKADLATKTPKPEVMHMRGGEVWRLWDLGELVVKRQGAINGTAGEVRLGR